MRRRHDRRWWTTVGVVLLTLLGVVVAPTGAALATPVVAAADPEESDNGLAAKLEEAAVAYSEAQVKLKKSQKRQAELEKQVKTADKEYLAKSAQVSQMAAGRYKGSQVSILSALLNAKTSSDMMQGATIAAYVIDRDDDLLRELNDLRVNGQQRRADLNKEILEQEKHIKALDKARTKAENALAAAGGMISAGFNGNVGAAKPAPRNADGGWSGQSCNIDDPTGTGGCITKRMHHMLIEAQLANFQRFTRCWRTQSWGEHPKGRACDFSAEKSTFGGTATGDDKRYGDKLAAWAVKNAEALGIMYVIWFNQIWEYGAGWHSYNGDGSPSGDHENHVHISMF
ncbi:hypothetical protein GCM10009682_16650 [Luedemannella flava]|uniref:ARB-07466-like C-terminal domain-containing protein n=2 Tax=Luedemannella flava TaxID=349316 RepID=A0ABP4Y101_9ACTN